MFLQLLLMLSSVCFCCCCCCFCLFLLCQAHQAEAFFLLLLSLLLFYFFLVVFVFTQYRRVTALATHLLSSVNKLSAVPVTKIPHQTTNTVCLLFCFSDLGTCYSGVRLQGCTVQRINQSMGGPRQHTLIALNRRCVAKWQWTKLRVRTRKVNAQD